MALLSYLVLFLLHWQSFCLPLDDDDDDDDLFADDFLIYLTTLVAMGWVGATHIKRLGSRGKTIKRKRRSVLSLMRELGGHQDRYYRMSGQSFWKLHRLPFWRRQTSDLRCFEVGLSLEIF